MNISDLIFFLLGYIFLLLIFIFSSKGNKDLKIILLTHQISIYKRKIRKPLIYNRDRIFWIIVSTFFKDWKSVLHLVKPATVIKWHKKGFKLFWRWKSRSDKVGRPKIPRKIICLIQKIAKENITWGVPRIQAELALIGHDYAESTIARYIPRKRGPSSQKWRSFLKNHMKDTVAIDFFTSFTINFNILYCFIILSHDRRKILHFNVTKHPTAEWTKQQIREAFPDDKAPKYLIRDRDSIYGGGFKDFLKSFEIKDIKITAQSPWQNPYCERVIGSIRRECLNHMIIFNENHLRKIMKEYIHYYNNTRPHQSLNKNSPNNRNIEPEEIGEITSNPILNGLHHQYKRAA